MGTEDKSRSQWSESLEHPHANLVLYLLSHAAFSLIVSATLDLAQRPPLQNGLSCVYSGI